jgi:hypothetical protein
MLATNLGLLIRAKEKGIGTIARGPGPGQTKNESARPLSALQFKAWSLVEGQLNVREAGSLTGG